MTRLRAGVIGLGVGAHHAEAFDRHSDCALAAVCDFEEGKRAEAAKRYPHARIYSEADQLLDDPEIDLVCIASYDDHHAAQALRSLETGRHVFVEKPLCTRPEETAAIRAALRRCPELRLSSNTLLRLSPRFGSLRDDIRAGRLGRLFAIEGDYNYGRLWKLTDGWRGRIPGYSVMLGGGVHMADLLLWLTGERVVEAFAFGNGIASAESEFRGRDMAMALLRFESGLVGKLSANFGCVEPHFHRLLVYGDKGTFENGREHALHWRSRDPAEPPVRVDTAYPGAPKSALVACFVDAILGRSRSPVEEDDVFSAMSVCHAIDQSLETGRPVAVRYY